MGWFSGPKTDAERAAAGMAVWDRRVASTR